MTARSTIQNYTSDIELRGAAHAPAETARSSALQSLSWALVDGEGRGERYAVRPPLVRAAPWPDVRRGRTHTRYQVLRNSSGSLAMFAAILPASLNN